MTHLFVQTFILFLIFAAAVAIDVRAAARGIFPFSSFVAAYYFVFYGLFSLYAAYWVKALPYRLDGVDWSVVGFTVLFVVLQLAAVAAPTARPSRRDTDGREATAPLVVMAFGLVAFNILFHLMPALSHLPSIPQLRSPSWLFGFSVLSYLCFERRLPKTLVAAFIGLSALKLGLDAAEGYLTQIVLTFVMLVCVAVVHGAYRAAVVCLLVCAAAVPSYGYVRYLSRELISGEPAAVSGFRPDFSLHSLTVSLGAAARRSSHALLTDYVMDMTPKSIPFTPRNPLLDALTDHVPRLFWSDKPLENRGNAFGKRYGILAPNDAETSWNIPWIVDFYIAFGRTRALIWIFVIGGLMGLGICWMSSRSRRVFWFGVYSATLFPLFYQESNFSVMTGSLFWVLAFLLAGRFVVERLCRPFARDVPGRQAETSS